MTFVSIPRPPLEEQYAAAVVETSLAGLATLDAFEPRADLQSLTEVLALGFESALPRVGRFGEGVFVGPLSAVIGMDLYRVYVVGLAEDGYPGRLHEDALLPDELRTVTDGELMSARERLDAKHRHLLAAFASAAHVTASFPRGDLRLARCPGCGFITNTPAAINPMCESEEYASSVFISSCLIAMIAPYTMPMTHSTITHVCHIPTPIGITGTTRRIKP